MDADARIGRSETGRAARSVYVTIRRAPGALLADATATLVAAWRTETLVDAASSAPLVRLPGPRTGDRTSTDGKAAQDALHFRHGVECPVKTVGGELYARVSAAPYNRAGDYARLAEAALKLGS